MNTSLSVVILEQTPHPRPRLTKSKKTTIEREKRYPSPLCEQKQRCCLLLFITDTFSLLFYKCLGAALCVYCSGRRTTECHICDRYRRTSGNS
jgi:hypothetical protein